MKTVTLKNILSLVVAGFVALNSSQLVADEKGFTLDNAIKAQVFQELKHNVEHLYESVRQAEPVTDPEDEIRRTADTGFVLPQLEPIVNNDSRVINAIN